MCPQSVLNLQGVLVNSGTGSYTFGASYKSGTMRLDSLVSLLINYSYLLLQITSLITTPIQYLPEYLMFLFVSVWKSHVFINSNLSVCRWSTFRYICAVKVKVQRLSTCLPSGKKKGRMIERIWHSITEQFSFISV